MRKVYRAYNMNVVQQAHRYTLCLLRRREEEVYLGTLERVHDAKGDQQAKDVGQVTSVEIHRFASTTQAVSKSEGHK